MNDNNSQNRISLTEKVPLNKPLVIHIETTNRCNFRCKFCPESDPNYSNLSGGYKIMKINDFKKIIDNIKLSFNKISRLRLWIMGEPLINPDIFSMIDYAKKVDIADSVELTSNASLINSQKASSIINSRLDLIKISIYGFNNNDFKSTTNSGIPFNKILENIKLLFEMRNSTPSSNLKIMAKTVGEISDKKLTKYMNLLSKHVDYIEINQIHSWTDSQDSIGQNSTINNQKAFKEVCPFPFYTLAIHSDGKLSPCCVDWKKEVFLGNCLEESLDSIWSGNKIKDLRLSHLKRDLNSHIGCKGCDYFIDNTSDNLDSLKIEEYVKRY